VADRGAHIRGALGAERRRVRSRSLPTVSWDGTSPSSPWTAARRLSAQLAVAIALLIDSGSTSLTRALIFLLVAFFVNPLGRAWEVAGIGHRLPETT
jgi:hypothetical protein